MQLISSHQLPTFTPPPKKNLPKNAQKIEIHTFSVWECNIASYQTKVQGTSLDIFLEKILQFFGPTSRIYDQQQ